MPQQVASVGMVDLLRPTDARVASDSAKEHDDLLQSQPREHVIA